MPVAKVCWAAKEAVVAPGAVVFSSTDTVFESPFATIRSGLPSPLKSAAVTENGPLPVAKVCWAAKEAVAAPGAVVFSSTDTVFDAVVRDDQVGLAIAVEVRRRHGVRTAAGGEGLLGGEGGGGGPRRRRVQQHRHRVRALVRDDQVGLAIAVEVRRRHGARRAAGGEGLSGRRRRGWWPRAPSCSAAPTPCSSLVVRDDQVGLAIAVEVRRRHGARIGAGGEGLLGGEGGGGGPGRRRVQQHRHRVRAEVRDDQVGLAIAVQVRRRHGYADQCRWRRSVWAAKEGVVAPGAVVFSSTDTVFETDVRDDQVGLAIAVQVRRRSRKPACCRSRSPSWRPA